ncbi:hypothetical protein STRAU_4496 [Streptomyces aurantiacus JA 4570]|uniref:Uncharacterized protein n=1 Tax=Streptomyces aurantiacus JA 4570 TaxID=1286094 RepID=S3ZVS3_9ACTN|nr:hypothetical protein STRAU_4496 [Streptomyces aurantiacus JA 4570]
MRRPGAARALGCAGRGAAARVIYSGDVRPAAG